MKILKFFATNWAAWLIILAMWLITPYVQDVATFDAISDLLKRLNVAQALALGGVIICLGTLATYIFSIKETKL